MTAKLNANELAVFAALAEEIQNCTGGQFGYSDGIKLPAGIERKQISGYVSQLVQKGLFAVDPEFGQVQVDEGFFSVAREYNICFGREFETLRGRWETV